MNMMNPIAPSAPRGPVLREAAPATRDASAEQSSSALPLLTQYTRIALRRKWLILGSILTMLALGLIYTLVQTRLYTAASTIEIQRDGDRVVKLESVARETSTADLEFYQTQFGLLKARSLAERVARNMKLASDPKFVSAYKLQPKAGSAPQSLEARTDAAASILLHNVTVTPVRASSLVGVEYTSPDPVLSASIANAWGKNFIEANLARRFDSTAYARNFLEGRLEQLRQRLEESERQLVNYAGSQKIINLPATVVAGSGQTSAPERSLVADNLSALNGELSAATADRIKAESRLRGAQGSTSPEALSNVTISSLRQRRSEASADYAKLMVQFEPGYPAARALAQQVAQLDGAIAREEGRVRSSIDANYRESLARESDLSARVEGLKSGLLDLRRRSIQYNIYQRDVDTNRQLYDGLLQRYKEIGIAGGVGNNNISIVDPAAVPVTPSRPNLINNMLIALLLGVGLGVALAFAREQIDETVKDPDDILRTIGVPVLGAIPNSGDTDPVLALQDRKSSIVEAYLSVQTNLEFTTAHGVPRSFAVTSTRPAEGKSASIFAIAQTMARAKRRVVLIDCDMRSPSIHRLVGIDNVRGVSNFLSGSDDIDALLRAVGEDGLQIMPSGPQPPNAAELLTGDRLNKLIAQLLTHFDHVLVDAPPVMGLADAPLIASKVEATVFVVESNAVRASLVRVALGRLRSANAHLVGVVLTKFDARRAHYGYGYDYGYSYGDAKSERAY